MALFSEGTKGLSLRRIFARGAALFPKRQSPLKAVLGALLAGWFARDLSAMDKGSGKIPGAGMSRF